MSTQTDILIILEQHRGHYLSGERIATTLGLSRNAIWKAIKGLREHGYAIESKTNLGYCLKEENDFLSVTSITPYLKNPLLAKTLEVYDTLESTNSLGKEKALGGAPEGTVIIAECQTGGRGRMGRSFFSPKGTGIYLSMILRPQKAIDQSLFMTIGASVLIQQAIKKVTGLETGIKWVNDLYLENKKICGILTEAAADFETGTIDYVVLGVGINFIKPKDAFPEDLATIAGALYETPPPGQLRSQLTAEIINVLSTLSNLTNHKDIMEIYREHSLVLGRKVTLHCAGETLVGTVTAIDDDGHLLLKKDDGSTQTILSGEVSLRWPV